LLGLRAEAGFSSPLPNGTRWDSSVFKIEWPAAMSQPLLCWKGMMKSVVCPRP
jgi:hypothetical protein